ncbi:sulfotransferase family 2 domain-containing protein [Marivita sp. S2033]|uniref:sulfotransferase family 2 domain-containing protein n=1 Tax=Marivita sp. S2033 TaxID=3373187 RepID=UPI003981A03F
MTANFDYFVVFAEMRTGSNLLEDYLNQIDGITCFGEAFNPSFIGYPNRDDILGVTHLQREDNPDRLLKAIRTQARKLGGFRYFHDHDPRILPTLLTDPRCAKVILTRNPIDSYISLKIARATDQWKLTNFKNAKTATAHFDAHEFERHVGTLQTRQLELMHGLQVTGQTAFYIGYDDLHDTDVLSGLAHWLGVPTAPDSFQSTLKPQNPQPLSAKVENFDQMQAALRSFDRFDLTRTPNFEPRRGPVVPSYKACTTRPLLYLPIRSGPEDMVSQWMSALDGDGSELETKFNQKTLRGWLLDNPGHQRFTVLRHPVARAHAAFCDRILNTGPGSFTMIRNQLIRFHDIDLPEDMNDPAYDAAAHKAAFKGFLRFLRANLNGQTSIRVDAHWASQVSCLQGMSEFCLPDHVLREADVSTALPAIARKLGIATPPPIAHTAHPLHEKLARVYDADIETLCRDAYPRDYMMFGFKDLDVKNPA